MMTEQWSLCGAQCQPHHSTGESCDTDLARSGLVPPRLLLGLATAGMDRTRPGQVAPASSQGAKEQTFVFHLLFERLPIRSDPNEHITAHLHSAVAFVRIAKIISFNQTKTQQTKKPTIKPIPSPNRIDDHHEPPFLGFLDFSTSRLSTSSFPLTDHV